MSETDKAKTAMPSGWVRTELGQLGHVASGSTPSTKDEANFGGDIPWLTPADLSGFQGKFIERGRRSLSKQGLASCSAPLLPAGTVVFSSRAPIGYVAICRHPTATNQGFKNLVPCAGVFNEYVFYYLRGGKRLAESRASGTTFLEITAKRFARLPVPLPPLPEQKRIVETIEELFTRLEAGVEALKTAQRRLKAYRQAVLRDAFTGRLTAEWRERELQNPDSPLRKQPAAEASGLPSNWEWRRLEQCCSTITKGESPGWQGFAYVEDGVVFIRSQNVLVGMLDLSEHVRIPRAFHEKLTRSQVRAGDVLYNLVGASIGRCAVLPLDAPEANVNQAVAVLRPLPSVSPAFLMNLLNSPDYQQQMLSKRVEVARPNVSLQDLRNQKIPLPPQHEQQEIVEEIDRRFSLADAAEQTIERSLKQAERLRQSILKRAFEGKLVPQDPNDEPADKLLERIKAEKSALLETTGKGRRRRRKEEQHDDA